MALVDLSEFDQRLHSCPELIREIVAVLRTAADEVVGPEWRAHSGLHGGWGLSAHRGRRVFCRIDPKPTVPHVCVSIPGATEPELKRAGVLHRRKDAASWVDVMDVEGAVVCGRIMKDLAQSAPSVARSGGSVSSLPESRPLSIGSGVVTTGIYAIINTLEPIRVPYGQPCPAPLAAITHRCYIGKAKDFERRWRNDHLPYLLNGRHACTCLLDAFQDWLRSDASRLELLARSPKAFKTEWLVRATDTPRPEWNLGPFIFRVLEEVEPEMLTEREREYHAVNPGGYRGGTNDGRRWKKWDGK